MANYASADWHGAQWAWDKVKSFLKGEDRLYFLGDAIDRGSGRVHDGGWLMMKEMLFDERVFYLKGNHEDLLYDAYFDEEDSKNRRLCYVNGGKDTLAAAEADFNAGLVFSRIKNLPLMFKYKHPDGKVIFMSHSGSTDIDSGHALLWDRVEFLTSTNWTDYDYVIHGHTSAKHIIQELKDVNEFYWNTPKGGQYDIPEHKGGAYFYFPWRCTVDCRTIRSNQIVLLNLDTFEQHIFTKDEK